MKELVRVKDAKGPSLNLPSIRLFRLHLVLAGLTSIYVPLPRLVALFPLNPADPEFQDPDPNPRRHVHIPSGGI